MKNSHFDIIKYPIITEKSTRATEENKYVFEVDVNASKGEVKKAVEKIFNVTVKAVNIINVFGKTKYFRGRKGKRNDYKKAIVSIEQGQTIDVAAGV